MEGKDDAKLLVANTGVLIAHPVFVQVLHFFLLSDGNLLWFSIGAILNSLPASFKASDRGLDNPTWSMVEQT